MTYTRVCIYERCIKIKFDGFSTCHIWDYIPSEQHQGYNIPFKVKTMLGCGTGSLIWWLLRENPNWLTGKNGFNVRTSNQCTGKGDEGFLFT